MKMTNNYGSIYDTIVYSTSLKIANDIFSIDTKYVPIGTLNIHIDYTV